MKILVIFLLLITTQANSQTKDTLYNPCKDSLYQTLKKKNLDSLSQREYEYYILKTKECGEYSGILNKVNDDDSSAKQTQKTITVILGISLIAGATFLVINLLKK